MTTQQALEKHEASAIELRKAEDRLEAEEKELLARRSELSALAILDHDEAAKRQLEAVSKRLVDITHNLEILVEARSRLDSRMAEARHQIALDERSKSIESILSLTAKRATILATIEEQATALATSIAEVWTVNGDALALSHELPDSTIVRSVFSQRHFTTALEKLLGQRLHRFGVGQCIRPSNFEEWTWQSTTRIPADFESLLRNLPLK